MRCRGFLLVVLVASAVLAIAGPAAAAGESAFVGTSASSAARGMGAGLAADGSTRTAWSTARAGTWSWRGRLARAAALDGVRVLAARSLRDVAISVSEDGRRYRHVKTVALRRGVWRVVDLRGRRARFVRISGRAKRPPGGGLAEVVVRVRPVGAAVASAGAAIAPSPGAAVLSGDEVAPQPAPSPGPPDDPGPVCAPRSSGPRPPARPAPPATVVPAPDPGGLPAPAPSDGRTFQGTITDPIDVKQLEGLPFWTRSHWLQPWRAYLETPPARRLRDAIGINFNAEANDAAPVARLLAANGFRRARIEIPWGDFAYEDPSKLIHREKFERALCAIRDAGLRPLILLNANDQQPVPSYRTKLTVAEDVSKGATQIRLEPESAAKVIAPYTGIDGAFAAESLILEVHDDVATLSKPLSATARFKDAAIPKGTVLDATVLRYLPFSPPEHDDGAPNPYSEATLEGWRHYVEAVTGFVTTMLGTTDFDLEVSNELNLNAAFWNVNAYFDTPLFAQPLRDQEIVDRTVAWVRDPKSKLPGVRLTNGFASQRPWDSGATSPKGLDALSKHYYPRNLRFPDVMTCDTRPVDPCRVDPLRASRPVDARSGPEGTRDDKGRWTDAFVPTYDTFFPEFWLTGIATETMVRDLAPREETFGGAAHGRAVAPAGGTPPEVWMTEMGLDTGWAESQHGLGLTLDDADIGHLRAKAALRTLVSYVNKGVTQVDLYAAVTREWGLVGGTFWDRWRDTGRYPGDETGGPVLVGVRRLVATLGDDTITTARSLTLASIGDYGGRKQFDGDGTPEHPDLFDRDALAVFPFQASDHRFVIPVYVMTRNLARTYGNGAAGPARFDLPAERYQLTIGGADAAKARVRAVDPLTGDAVPVDVVRRDGTWLVVELPVTDSPRLLILDDAGA